MRWIELKVLGEKPEPVTLYVGRCRVCGVDHDTVLEFVPYEAPVDGHNLYAVCPTTRQHIDICIDQFFYRSQILARLALPLGAGVTALDLRRLSRIIGPLDDAHDGDWVSLEDADYEQLAKALNAEGYNDKQREANLDKWSVGSIKLARWCAQLLDDIEHAPTEPPAVVKSTPEQQHSQNHEGGGEPVPVTTMRAEG